MICPQNGRFCDDKFCLGNQSCEREKCERLDLPAPPKPTLAEIERLVHAFHQRVLYFERDPSEYTRWPNERSLRRADSGYYSLWGEVMPDICMCQASECPQSAECYRYRAIPSEYRQAYADFYRGPELKCDGFVSIKGCDPRRLTHLPPQPQPPGIAPIPDKGE